MKIKVDGCTAYIEIYSDYFGRYHEVPEDTEISGAFWVRHASWHKYKSAVEVVEHNRIVFEQCYNEQVPLCNALPTL